MRAYLLPIRSARGIAAGAHSAELDALLASDDADTIGSAHAVRATILLSERDADTARQEALASALSSRMNAPVAWPTAARAALWMARPDLARGDLTALEQTAARGPLITLHRTVTEAGISALEGRVAEAIVAYGQATDGARQEGLPVLEAYAAIDMAMLLDASAPQVQAAAKRAREVLGGLQAQRLLEILEDALARSRDTPVQSASGRAGADRREPLAERS